MKIIIFDFEVFKYDVLLGAIILDNNKDPEYFQTWDKEEIKKSLCKAKEAIPVMATIMINVGLTIPALTADSPKIKAPTIPIEEPINEGTLRLASRINSNEISINSNSKIIGKGTFSLADKIENNNSVGRIS